MRKNQLLLLLSVLLVLIAAVCFNLNLNPAHAQVRGNILTLSSGVGGTGVEPPGSFSCESSKILNVEIDTGNMPSNFGLGKIQMTVPKNYFPDKGKIVPTVGGSSYATSYTITDGAADWIVTLTLKSFATVAGKITLPVQFKEHNCGVLVQGQAFIPKTELINAAGTVVDTVTTTNNPIVFGNTAPRHYSSVNGETRNNKTFHGGGTVKIDDTYYIDPANAVPIRFDMTVTLPWHQMDPDDSNKKLPFDDDKNRLYSSGTYEAELPTYPCSTGTCTAVFDAASSPGWTQVGNKLVFNYDVSAQITKPYDTKHVAELVYAAVNDKPFFLKFPNLKLKSFTSSDPITINTFTKNLKPVNQGPTDVIASTSSAQTFRMKGEPYGGYYSKWGGRDVGYDLGYMHEQALNWYLNITNPFSYPMVLDKAVDYNLDPRQYFDYIRVYHPLALGLTKIVGVMANGTKEEIPFSVSYSGGWARVVVDPIEPATRAAIEAQAAYVINNNITDYSTLPDITRRYDKLEFHIDERGKIPPGTRNNLIFVRTRYLNPYKVEPPHEYPANSTPLKNCNKPDSGGSENVNSMCNYGEWNFHLVKPAGLAPETYTVQSGQFHHLTQVPTYIEKEKVAFNGTPGTTVGSELRYDHAIRLCEFTAGHIHKGLTFTALLPPGAEFTLPASPTSADGLYVTTNKNGNSLNNEIRSRTMISNYKGTGRTAVQIVFNDFRHGAYFNAIDRCPILYGHLKFKIGQDAIPMELEAAYKAQHSAQAGQIPSDLPNQIFTFYDFANETIIRKTEKVDNPAQMDYAGYTTDTPDGTFVMAYNANVIGKDLIDVNENGKTDDYIISDSLTFQASPPTEIRASKFILDSDGQPTRSDAPVAADDTYTFRLQVENKTTENQTKLILYEVLPQVGDQNYDIPGITYPARNSEFAGKLSGPVTGNQLGKYTIQYCTNPNPNWNPFIGAAPGGCSWQSSAADYSTVSAIRIELNNGQIVGPLETHYFDLPMKAPDTSENYDLSYDITANSYAVSFDGGNRYSVTNIVRALNNVSFPVEKIWDGGSNYPTVTIDLYQKIGSGAETIVSGKSITLSSDNADPANDKIWRGKFTDLPAIDMQTGEKITYSVKENRPDDSLIKYYTSSITGSVSEAGAVEGYKVTNKFTPPVTEVNANKVWKDGQVARTPVQVTLYQRLETENEDDAVLVPDTELKTIQGKTCLTGNPATFTPSTDATDANATQMVTQLWCVDEVNPRGVKYIYSVKETSQPGSGWTVEYDENDPLTVTNKYTPPTAPVTGTTVWVNGPVDPTTGKPEAFMQLYQKVGTGAETPVANSKIDVSTLTAIGTPETDAGGNQVWKVTKTWEDMPTTDIMGQPISYSIKETDTNLTEITPPSYDKTQPDPLKIVNTYRAPYVEIKATKNWAGGTELQRPAFNVGIYIKEGDQLIRPENYAGTNKLPTPIFGTGSTPAVTYETAGVVDVPVSAGTGVMTQDFYWYVPRTYNDGSPVTYYFEEMLGDGAAAAPLSSTTAPTEYEKTYQYDEAAATGTGETRTMSILNTYVPPMLKDTEKFVGKKEWSGGAEADRKDVTLVVWRKTANGAAERVDDAAHSFDRLLAAAAAATHSWTAEWDNVLPKTEQATGLPYTYWVDEADVPDGWTRTNPVGNTLPADEADRKIVRNVYVLPQGPVEATKTWVGGSTLTPPTVTFTLYRIADGMIDREAVPLTEIVGGLADFETTNPVTKTPVDNTPIAMKWQTNLKNQDGKPYTFSVDEAAVANYEKTINPANPLELTNTYKSPKITVTPEVKWLGGAVTDRETVTVTLYQKDPVTGTVTVAGTYEMKADEAGTHNWRHAFNDLDEREQTTGQPYVYYADESATTDQWTKVKSEADQTPIQTNETLIITNKYVPKAGEISGRKIWVNGANADKTSVELRLYRKTAGTPFAQVGDPKTVTTDAPTATWQDMQEKDTDGNPYTYIVDETLNVYDVAQGKWVKVKADGVTETADQNDSLTVRNKFVTKTMPVTGDLTFVNGPAAKPAVTMHLYRINPDSTRTEVGTAKDFLPGNAVTLANTWADMPQYDDTGAEIKYEVDVVTEPENYYRVEGATGTEHTTANHDLSIHLRYKTPRTEVKVTKNWVNGSALRRPEVTLYLHQNGVMYLGTGAPLTIPATTETGVMSDSSKSWTDLPLTDDNGVPYIYTVTEELAAGQPYTVAYDNGADPRVVTNTYVPPTIAAVTGEVEWHGGPDAKEGVTVTLKRKTGSGTPIGIGVGEDHLFPPASYTQDSHPWADLPSTDLDGNPYIYSLEHKGANPTDYTSQQDPTNPLKVHYYYKQPMVEVTGTKAWVGGTTLTHPSVQLELKRKTATGTEETVPVSDLSADAGFTAQNPVQITAGTTTVHWKTFEKAMNGDAYIFSIGEVTVPTGYEMTADNTTLTVTNRFVPSNIEIKAVKNWDGGTNANGGVRPNVTFTITRTLNGIPEAVTGFVNEAGYATTESVTLTAPASGAEVKWKVPAAEQATGTPYVYAVTEAAVAGYTTAITNAGDVWTATNRYEIPTAKLTIKVHWDGGPSPYPATSVDIKANGTTVQNVPFGSDGLATYTQADIELPLTDRDGNPITYTIGQPGSPTKYTETVNEPGGTQLDPNNQKTLNVTNKYVPGRGDVHGYKTWIGGEALREDIWFKLYREDAGGTLVPVSAEDGGGIRKLTPADVETLWTNVKIEADDGAPYVFGVKEVNEDGTNEAWTPTDFVKAEAGTTVTNTYVPPVIAAMEGKKIWSPSATDHPEIWFELMRKVGENGTAEVVTDGHGISRQQLIYPTVSVFWHDLPGRTNRGELYTYFVREVDANGADFTPEGFDKSENGMEVTNARLSNLTVKLITTPPSGTMFKVTVVSDNDVRPEAQLNSDGEDVLTPSTVTHEKMKLAVYRIQLPDINYDEWAVESIDCKSRPLDSAGDYDTDVEINAQLDLHGHLTGLFSIPNMPIERDIYCTYKLRNLSIGKIVVKNLTYPNANVNGGILPTYHYGTAGTGYANFDLSTSDTPNSADVTPGAYSVAQQNLNGWVTIDVIVTSSYYGRNPLTRKSEDPTGGFTFLNGGTLPAGYTGTGFDSVADFEVKGGEEVTITYVNVPPNTVLLKKVTIPGGVSERFPIAGLFEGTIGSNQILVRTDVTPGTGERHAVKELPSEGWTKHSVSCVEVGPVNQNVSSGDIYSMEAWYGLDEGEVVMCTFVNRMFGADELEEMEVNDPDVPGFTDKGFAGGGLGSGFYANGLPRTGFSPNRVTVLPEQTAAKLYQASELKLTIPKLGLSMKIEGVPQVDGAWDVSWLGTEAGYLMGTSYPTHAGNSVITAHVWDAYNNPGPFANLKTLVYGDQIEISAYGKTYVYEVRDSKQVLETNVEKVTESKDGTWVTLMTCEDYSEALDDYRYRRVVEATLIEVK